MELDRLFHDNRLRTSGLARAHVRGGAGAIVRHLPTGTIVESSGIGGGRGRKRKHRPFEVIYIGASSDSPPKPKLKVFLDSWLVKSRNFNDRMVISGLDSEFTDLVVNHLIWLEIHFDGTTGAPDTASVKHGVHWDEYDKPVKFDDDSSANKKQEKAYELIAYARAKNDDLASFHPLAIDIADGAGGKMQLIQRVDTNLILCADCHEASNVMLPRPYFLPGPDLS